MFESYKQTSIPVFFYHHVNLENKNDCIKPDIFEWQMNYLRHKGFKGIFLNELIDYQAGKISFEKQRAISINFDDGYIDNWQYAFPILKKYNIKATIFVITSKIREESYQADGYLSWPDLKLMHSSGLIDIQSHTHTHFNCGSLNVSEIKKELSLSKKIIEERLNKSCSFVCWPWGRYNASSIPIASECGYLGALTSERGINTIGADCMQIKRVNVWPKLENHKFWFRSRLFIYSNKVVGKFYASIINKITKNFVVNWHLI